MVDYELSESALLHLLAYALEEVDGVRLAGPRKVGEVLAGRRKAARVVRDEDGVRVDLGLVARYGKPLPELGREVQRAVSEAFRATAGLKVKEVNVAFLEVEPADAP